MPDTSGTTDRVGIHTFHPSSTHPLLNALGSRHEETLRRHLKQVLAAEEQQDEWQRKQNGIRLPREVVLSLQVASKGLEDETERLFKLRSNHAQRVHKRNKELHQILESCTAAWKDCEKAGCERVATKGMVDDLRLELAGLQCEERRLHSSITSSRDGVVGHFRATLTCQGLQTLDLETALYDVLHPMRQALCQSLGLRRGLVAASLSERSDTDVNFYVQIREAGHMMIDDATQLRAIMESGLLVRALSSALTGAPLQQNPLQRYFHSQKGVVVAALSTLEFKPLVSIWAPELGAVPLGIVFSDQAPRVPAVGKVLCDSWAAEVGIENDDALVWVKDVACSEADPQKLHATLESVRPLVLHFIPSTGLSPSLVAWPENQLQPLSAPDRLLGSLW